jgi:hypothetical protein
MDKHIKKIAKLITEDPDVFNEGWEEEGIKDPFPRERTPEELEAIANDPELIDHLRKKMLSPEELEQVQFEKEKRDRRDERAFNRSMEADLTPAITCDEVQEITRQDYESTLVGAVPDLGDRGSEYMTHIENCQVCAAHKQQEEENMLQDPRAWQEDPHEDEQIEDFRQEEEEDWRSGQSPDSW